MNEVLRFVIQRVATKTFWMFVVTTFLGIVMYDMRSNFKDQVFQQAVGSLRKTGWNNWNPITPFDR